MGAKVRKENPIIILCFFLIILFLFLWHFCALYNFAHDVQLLLAIIIAANILKGDKYALPLRNCIFWRTNNNKMHIKVKAKSSLDELSRLSWRRMW